MSAADLTARAYLIGGLDPAGFDGDIQGQLAGIVGLAEAYCKDVDIRFLGGR